MSFDLDEYVQSKLPIEELKAYLPRVSKVEVHGVHPDMEIIAGLDLNFRIIEVVAESKRKEDNSNSLRPVFIFAKRGSEFLLVCCVTPGRDLLVHYSSMLGYFLRRYPRITMSVFSYPVAEQHIELWTELDENLVRPDDIVILGYSTFLKHSLHSDALFPTLSVRRNDFYTSTRFLADSGVVVNCLEANYGYWGNISERLSRKVCEFGAKEIIHIGKVGTLGHPSEVYKRIYIPSRFLIVRRGDVIHSAVDIQNSLGADRANSSSAHASVSTTMEETLHQRELMSEHNVDTIDIESSKIAYGIARYNAQTGGKVRFGAIHYSTDYLRMRHELYEKFEYDLSVKSSTFLKGKKNKILEQISVILQEYVNSYTHHTLKSRQDGKLAMSEKTPKLAQKPTRGASPVSRIP